MEKSRIREAAKSLGATFDVAETYNGQTVDAAIFDSCDKAILFEDFLENNRLMPVCECDVLEGFAVALVFCEIV